MARCTCMDMSDTQTFPHMEDQSAAIPLKLVSGECGRLALPSSSPVERPSFISRNGSRYRRRACVPRRVCRRFPSCYFPSQYAGQRGQRDHNLDTPCRPSRVRGGAPGYLPDLRRDPVHLRAARVGSPLRPARLWGRVASGCTPQRLPERVLGGHSFGAGGWSVVARPETQTIYHWLASGSESGVEVMGENFYVEHIADLFGCTAAVGPEYTRCALLLGDGSYMGMAPVQISDSGLILVALPRELFGSPEVPKAPGGEPAASSVPSIGLGSRAGPVVGVVFFVWDDAMFTAGRVWDEGALDGEAIVRAFGRNGDRWPSAEQLRAAARELGFTPESYATAEEAFELPEALPVAPALRAASKAKGSAKRGPPGGGDVRLAKLEGQVAQLVALLSSPAGADESGEETPRDKRGGAASAGRRARSDVGAAPRGSDLQSARGKFGGPAMSELPTMSKGRLGSALKNRGEREPKGRRFAPVEDLEDEEEEAEEHEPGGPAAKQSASETLMLAAAAALLGKTKKDKRKKKAFGISAGGDESGGSSDSDSVVMGAKGMALSAKLARSMEQHPDQFLKEMQGRMDRHLSGGSSSATGTSLEPRRAEDYVRQLPLEKQKVLGYHVWSLAHIYRQLQAGDEKGAQLSCLRGIASAEQSLLDQHWRSAWQLSGASEPPWSEWERTNAATHRRSHTASPLLSEAWVSVALARTKDESFLRKQRQDKKEEVPRG